MSWMLIAGIVHSILAIVHFAKKPDFADVSENGISLWFMQLWFYNFIVLFLFVADTFYSKLK